MPAPVRASTPLSRGFTLPWARSTGFGSRGHDSPPFQTAPLTPQGGCGLVAFAKAPPLYRLSLAVATNSPPRSSKRTARHWSTPLLLPSREGFVRGGSFLSCRARLSPPGFRLFSLPLRGAFQLSLTVLVRYRSRDVFRVGGRCPPPSHGISDPCYSAPTRFPSCLRLRGYHPLRRLFPEHFGFTTRKAYGLGPLNPTSHPPYDGRFSLPSAAFGRPYSRHRNCFLFLRVLRCFSSPRSRSLRPKRALWERVPLRHARLRIRESRVPRLPAPTPGLSQLATPFFGARAEPSPRRLSVAIPTRG